MKSKCLFIKKLMAFCLVTVLMITSSSVYAESVANTSKELEFISLQEIDSFLLDTGMPQDVVDSLDPEVKRTIYNTTENGEKKEFVGIETKEVSLSEESEGEIVPCYISPNDMELSLISFKEGTYKGYAQYSFYPSFEWKKMVHIKDDVFAFSLPDGWEVVPGKRGVGLQFQIPETHQWKKSGDITVPCEASITGYGFDGFIDFCRVKYVYRGTGYMYAYKKNPKVSNMIKVGYAHENSRGGIHLAGSIGVSIGPLSISFSPSGGVNMASVEDMFGF